MSKAVSVAIFEIDRAYGGPEEGGWYFDTGTPSEEFAIYTKFFAEDDPQVEAYTIFLRALVQEINYTEKRVHPSSVASNGDYLTVEVSEGYPKAYPSHRPHYE